MKIHKAFLLVCATMFATGTIATQWSYKGETGPEYWEGIDDDYDMCGKGFNQSPINLVDGFEAELPTIHVEYQKSDFKLVNNGNTIVGKMQKGNQIHINGEVYELKQFHIHLPSEHTLKGRSYPMEVHFVHQQENGQYLVVGALVEAKDEGGELGKLLSKSPKLKGTDRSIMSFKMHRIFPQELDYFAYNGSLTTPPCTEGVKWVLFKQPLVVKPKDIDSLQQIVSQNNRPVQDLNARFLMK